MIQKTQQTNFGAKLSPSAKTVVRNAAISPQTRSAIDILEKDEATKDVTIDIVTKKIFGKKFFSFSVKPNSETSLALTPHHPCFIKDPKSPIGLKVVPKRTFFWQTLDNMFQNNILKSEHLQKLTKVFEERRLLLDRLLSLKKPCKTSGKLSGKIGQQTATLISLTTVKK